MNTPVFANIYPPNRSSAVVPNAPLGPLYRAPQEAIDRVAAAGARALGDPAIQIDAKGGAAAQELKESEARLAARMRELQLNAVGVLTGMSQGVLKQKERASVLLASVKGYFDGHYAGQSPESMHSHLPDIGGAYLLFRTAGVSARELDFLFVHLKDFSYFDFKSCKSALKDFCEIYLEGNPGLDDARDAIEEHFHETVDRLESLIYGVRPAHYENRVVRGLRDSLSEADRRKVDGIMYTPILIDMHAHFAKDELWNLVVNKAPSYLRILDRLSDAERKQLLANFSKEHLRIYKEIYERLIPQIKDAEYGAQLKAHFESIYKIHEERGVTLIQRNVTFNDFFVEYLSNEAYEATYPTKHGLRCANLTLFVPFFSTLFIAFRNLHRSEAAAYEEIEKAQPNQFARLLHRENRFNRFLEVIETHADSLGIATLPETLNGVSDTCRKLEKEWRQRFGVQYLETLKRLNQEQDIKQAVGLNPAQQRDFLKWQIKKETTYGKIEEHLRLVIFGARKLCSAPPDMPETTYHQDQGDAIIDQLLRSMDSCTTGWIGDLEQLARTFMRAIPREAEQKGRGADVDMVVASQDQFADEIHNILSSWRRDLVRSWANEYRKVRVEEEFNRWKAAHSVRIPAGVSVLERQRLEKEQKDNEQKVRRRIAADVNGKEVHLEYALIERSGAAYGVADSEVVSEEICRWTPQMEVHWADYFEKTCKKVETLISKVHREINASQRLRELFSGWCVKAVGGKWRARFYRDLSERMKSAVEIRVTHLKAVYEEICAGQVPDSEKEKELNSRVFEPLWKLLNSDAVCGQHLLRTYQEQIKNMILRKPEFNRLKADLLHFVEQAVAADRILNFKMSRVLDQEYKIRRSFVRDMLLSYGVLGFQ